MNKIIIFSLESLVSLSEYGGFSSATETHTFHILDEVFTIHMHEPYR